MYRGYYYDSDLGLYYLNSRYYDSKTGRFINADSMVSTGQGIIGNNMFAYCNNNPVNKSKKNNSYTTSSSVLSSSISYASEIASIHSGLFATNATAVSSSSSNEFNLFGYELRYSTGWEITTSMSSGLLGIFGISSYTTHIQGQPGIIYAFAGSTSDAMNWFDTTYYTGMGVNLFDVMSAEVQLETVGVGATVAIGNLSIGADLNLIGGTSITFAINTDLGNGLIQTDGFAMGINTGLLVAVTIWIYKSVTTGDTSPVPGLS